MVAESRRTCGCNLIAGCYYWDDVNVHVWRLLECCFALALPKAFSMYLRELPSSGIPRRSNSLPVDCQRVTGLSARSFHIRVVKNSPSEEIP